MQVRTRSITLEVDLHGPADGEPLLLIMGLGMQLVAWHDGLVQQLAGRGFRVIRFDNRDVGLSQRFDHLGTPNVAWQSLRYLMRMPLTPAYRLADMAEDTVELLDALGIDRAHVCGASMGGMIAQRLALRHPHRVRSLVLIMTSSGARSLPGPTRQARAALLGRPASATADAMLAHYVHLFRVIGSPGFPTPGSELTATLRRSLERGGLDSSSAFARQLTAVAADGDRTPLLAQVRVPTQVIHGQADPLIPIASGMQLAQAIPGARLDSVPGMGHDLPAALWPRFADGIAAAAMRARGV